MFWHFSKKKEKKIVSLLMSIIPFNPCKPRLLLNGTHVNRIAPKRGACADQVNFFRGEALSDQGWSNQFYHCKNPYFGKSREGVNPLSPPLDPPMQHPIRGYSVCWQKFADRNFFENVTSSPKGNDAHLRAIINLKGLLRCSMAANSTGSGPIWLKFEHNQNIMYVLITCKFKKYLINSNQEKV